MWAWFSDPFGTDAANDNPAGAGAFAYNLRFPGQYFDGETGLHYNYARDYDPATGRYVESDPIGLQGGINTYTFVNDTPVMDDDTDGLEAVSYLLHHPPGLPSELPSPTVRPEVKSYICKFLKECNGNRNCAFGKIYAIRHQQVGNTFPNWNDPVMREAENFSLSAAFSAWDSLGQTSYAGVYFWQFHKIARGLPFIHTSPYSNDALNAGLSGKDFTGTSPEDMLKWCSDCGK
jgi:RHS repeat-associated protein